MKIQGKLHRITDITAFAHSYITTGGKPTQGFTDFGKARVVLATDLPGGQFTGGFIPSMSMTADTDSQSRFSFTAPDSLAAFRGQVVAFDVKTMPPPFPGLQPIPIFSPVYRSAVFKFSDVSASEQDSLQDIFVFMAVTPDANGITQQQLDAELSNLRASLQLDRLRAVILSSKISVHAERSGGDVDFAAFVRGSTSSDLAEVIEVKADEIVIDLPGPDFIVGLCVDKSAIEAQIRKGLVGLSKRVSATLLHGLQAQAPQLSALVTVSVWRTRFPQTGSTSFKVPGTTQSIPIPVHAIVPDAAFGIPRMLY
jgi:hypothetical protein